MPHRIIWPTARELARAAGFPAGRYAPSRVYRPHDQHAGGTTSVLVANVLTAVRFRVFAPIEIAALCADITATAVGAYRLGLYAVNNDNQPGTLLGEAATGDSSSNTDANMLKALSPTIKRSTGQDVFIAIVANAGGAGATWTVTTESGAPSIMGGSTVVRALRAAGHVAGWKVAHVYAALPDPFGTPTEAVIGTDVIPLLGLKTAA